MILQNVTVAVRLRPLSGKERLDGCSECIQVLQENRILIPPDKIFAFDHSFPIITSQREIFESSIQSILDNFLKGFNATILAYGQVFLNLNK
jgi:hypothetical protein